MRNQMYFSHTIQSSTEQKPKQRTRTKILSQMEECRTLANTHTHANLHLKPTQTYTHLLTQTHISKHTEFVYVEKGDVVQNQYTFKVQILRIALEMLECLSDYKD